MAKKEKAMTKSTGLYITSYRDKDKAKQAAKHLRSGKTPLPRAIYWPHGCYAHVEKTSSGLWGVYIKRRPK